MQSHKSWLVAIAACVMAGASMIGCAATAPYNPDSLANTEYSSVAGICQSVMGLSPGERPTGGNWLGNDRLDYWTSHYNGCILSLSDSLQQAQAGAATQQAAADCRAKGLQPGTPELALCVLQGANNRPQPTPTQATSSASAATLSTVSTSRTYYAAGPHETARREQVACAALGISPAEGAFKSCVKSLGDTFYAIDHPIN